MNGVLPYLTNAPPSFTLAQAANSSGWHEVGSIGQINDITMRTCAVKPVRMAYASAISGADFHEAFTSEGDNNCTAT